MDDKRIFFYECRGEENAIGLKLEVYDSGKVVKSVFSSVFNNRSPKSLQAKTLSPDMAKDLVEKIAAYKFIQSNSNPAGSSMVFDGEHIKIEISLKDKNISYEISNATQFSSLYCSEIKTLEDLFK